MSARTQIDLTRLTPDTITGATALALRKQKGINQQAFWGPLGVTQSGGSRYEAGRAIPKPVRILLAIAHSDKPLKVVGKLRGEQ